MPDQFPEDGVLVLDSQGRERLRFTPGGGDLDPSGRLYAHRPEELNGSGSKLAIADVEHQKVRWLDTSAPFAIVYAP